MLAPHTRLPHVPPSMPSSSGHCCQRIGAGREGFGEGVAPQGNKLCCYTPSTQLPILPPTSSSPGSQDFSWECE